MVRRIAILVTSITVLLTAFAIGSLASNVRAAQPADAQKWEYAMMVSAASDGSVTVLTFDETEQKGINDFFDAFKTTVGRDKIPAVYYANILGQRYGWELVSHETDNSGELFYFKRPFGQ